MAQQIDVDAVLARIRAQIRRKSLRPSSFFADFDRLKHGKITKNQFVRALGMSGITFSEPEGDALCAKYDHPKDKLCVAYNGFINDMLDVDLSLEKTPMAGARENKTAGHSIAEVDPEAWKRIKAFQNKLTTYGTARGLSLITLFQDFDKFRNGYVTKEQFRRCVKEVEVGEADAALTMRDSYEDALHFDTYDEEKDEQIQSYEARDADDVVDSLRSQMLRLRVHPLDFMKDNDPRHTGLIPMHAFLKTLGVLKLNLRDQDAPLLFDKYGGGGDKIKYRVFCDELEKVFDDDQQFATGKKRSEVGEAAIKVRQFYQLSEENNRVADEAEEIVRKFVQSRRVSVAPVFQDFDKRKAQVITEPHFMRSIAQFNFGLTNEQIKQVIRRYASHGVDGSSGVRYTQFLRAIDEKVTYVDGAAKKREAKDKQMAYINSLQDRVPDASLVDEDALFHRMQEYVITRRIRLHNFFQDFDKLRKGVLNPDGFRKALNLSGIAVNDDEFEVLKRKYPSNKVPDGVAWLKFVEDIMSAEVATGLEKNPLASGAGKQFKYDVEARTYGEEGIAEELRPALKRVTERFIKTVRERDLIPEQPFKRFDKLHKNYVTIPQFNAALTFVQLVPIPSADELEALTKCYTIKGTEFVGYAGLVKLCDDTSKGAYALGLGHAPEVLENVEEEVVEVKPVDVDEVLARFKKDLARRRVQISDFVVIYDRLRSGRIPLAKVATVLQTAGLRVTDRELDALEQKYLDPKDKFRFMYKDFLGAIDLD